MSRLIDAYIFVKAAIYPFSFAKNLEGHSISGHVHSGKGGEIPKIEKPKYAHRFNPNKFLATTHLCTSVGPS